MLGAATAGGQPPAAPPPVAAPLPGTLAPLGGAAVFGPPVDQPFTPKELFPAAATTPAAPPPPPAPVVELYARSGAALFPPPPPPVWTGTAEAGLNGATGNAELFNLRVGVNAQRKAAGTVFTTDLLYTYTDQNGARTLNQAIGNARGEVLFAGTPWSLFAATQVEYDEFRVYDFRAGVYGGAGYRAFDDGQRALKLRAGAGAVRELATRPTVATPTGPARPDARWVPEAVFGADYRVRVTDRGSFLGLVDLYPRIDDWSQYRVRARAGYEHVLDPDRGMVLRFGVQDRYDSSPGVGGNRNDLTYFTTLGMRF